DNQIEAVSYCGSHRRTHSVLNRMSGGVSEQRGVDATKAIFHSPHHGVSFFRSPTKLPIRSVQREAEQSINGLTAGDFPTWHATDTVCDDHAVTSFFKQLARQSLIVSEIGEHCFQRSSGAHDQKMIFVLGTHVALVRHAIQIDVDA